MGGKLDRELATTKEGRAILKEYSTAKQEWEKHKEIGKGLFIRYQIAKTKRANFMREL